MRKHHLCTVGVAAAILWLAPAVSEAQGVGRAARTSRPAEGPSSRIGGIGGRYTRTPGGSPDLSLRGGGRPVVNQMPRQQYSGLRDFRPRAPLASALLPPRTGAVSRTHTGADSLFRLGYLPTTAHARVSGMTRLTRLDTPLYGWNRTEALPPLKTPLYIARPYASRFHKYFDLVPAKSATYVDETPLRFKRVVDGLIQQNESRFERMTKRGLALFQAGTDPSSERADVALDESADYFKMVRDLDRDAWLPSLLTAHVRLHQSKTQSAIYSLAHAAGRNPELFLDWPNLATYFGDYDEQSGQSAFLSEQLRRCMRRGTENPGSASAKALEAYAAWVLGDPVRARQALEAAESLNAQATVTDTNLKQVTWALRTVVR